MVDDVHRRHRQAGAICENANISVELDKPQPAGSAALFQQCHLRSGRYLDELRLPGCRSIVQDKLAIQRDDLAPTQKRERVDFHQLGIPLAKDAIELDEHVCNGVGRGPQIQIAKERGRIQRAKTTRDIDDMSPDRVGLLVGHFLDIHSALRREQDKRTSTGYVDQDGRIQFTLDRAALLDKDTLDTAAADHHAKYLACGGGALLGPVRHLDTTGFSAFAGRHLRLDDRRSDAGNGRGDFLRRPANYSFWNRHPRGQQNVLLGGVFFEIHFALVLSSVPGPMRSKELFFGWLVFGDGHHEMSDVEKVLVVQIFGNTVFLP